MVVRKYGKPYKRRARGRIAYSLARTTKGGRGKIKKRSSYKKRMGKR